MRYGAKVLFDDVSTTFLPGRRYGLTGPNGAGKSTFLKILTGELDAQKGTVVRPKRVGVLSQDQFAFDAYRVIDTVIMGNKPLWAALEEREVLYAKADMTDEAGMRLGELEGIVAENAGCTDALLLDEPTNHLDLESIHWLQDFLSRYQGTLIVISHDRHFLISVCTHTADIDYETIITYTGGYDDMVLAKTQVRSRLEAENAQREKKIAQLIEFIARFSAGTRSSQVTSRKKGGGRRAAAGRARAD